MEPGLGSPLVWLYYGIAICRQPVCGKSARVFAARPAKGRTELEQNVAAQVGVSPRCRPLSLSLVDAAPLSPPASTSPPACAQPLAPLTHPTYIGSKLEIALWGWRKNWNELASGSAEMIIFRRGSCRAPGARSLEQRYGRPTSYSARLYSKDRHGSRGTNRSIDCNHRICTHLNPRRRFEFLSNSLLRPHRRRRRHHHHHSLNRARR